jgi:LPXTG-site transpeptidase (sortase) family protein
MTVRQLQKLNIFLILFFGISLFIYFLLNGGAFGAQIRYALFLNSPFASAELKEGEILAVHASSSPSAEEDQGDVSFTLNIPKIDVTTPIVIPKEESKQGILASLEAGVGLYPGSVMPGKDGRSIVLGHSSRASWYRGNYAYIFSLLPKLKEGDEFFVTGGNKKYVYRIFATKILTPADTNKLFEEHVTVGSEMDLVTCYPIGSASKRNVIQARLVSIESI